MTQLANGDVFVNGGGADCGYEYLYSAEKGTWEMLPPVPSAKRYVPSGAVELADGRILVSGGHQCWGDASLVHSESWVFDRKVGSWSAAAPLHHARTIHSAVRLSCGHVESVVLRNRFFRIRSTKHVPDDGSVVA